MQSPGGATSVNSTMRANIRLFGFKCETDLKGKAIIPTLGIIDCRNILITGNTGLASAPVGREIIEIVRSEDITAANLARFSYQGDNSSERYYIVDRDWNKGILESQPGQESVKTNNVVSLYNRGYCVPVPIKTNHLTTPSYLNERTTP